MIDEATLLRAILAEPERDEPRLLYADFLRERGEWDRAEFIDVQIELAQMNRLGAAGSMSPETDHKIALRRRERELWHKLPVQPFIPGEGRWALGLTMDGTTPDAGSRYATVRRGFTDGVRVPLSWWLAHGPAVVRSTPLREVRLPSWITGLRRDDQNGRLFWWAEPWDEVLPEGQNWVEIYQRDFGHHDRPHTSAALIAWARATADQQEREAAERKARHAAGAPLEWRVARGNRTIYSSLATCWQDEDFTTPAFVGDRVKAVKTLDAPGVYVFADQYRPVLRDGWLSWDSEYDFTHSTPLVHQTTRG